MSIRHRNEFFIRYGGAALGGAAAAALGLALHQVWGSRAIYSTLYPAVAAAALLAGAGPTLVATGVCAATVARQLATGVIPPSPVENEKLVFFVLAGVLLGVLSEGIHRSRRLAHEAAEAERRARLARDEILAVVAHDLKNPLNIMSLQVELMERARAPGAPVRSVAVLKRSIDAMARLIADLLDASALEAGQLRLETEVTDLAALAREAVDARAEVAGSREVRLVANLPEEVVPVRCDAGRLAQALGNLLANALKFTPAGGVVSVSLSRTGGSVLLEVADSGPGIEPERLATIFQRYERGRRATGGETGLGLYIAKGLVEAHGGRIGVNSRPGMGTTFWVALPALSARRRQGTGAASAGVQA